MRAHRFPPRWLVECRPHEHGSGHNVHDDAHPQPEPERPGLWGRRRRARSAFGRAWCTWAAALVPEYFWSRVRTELRPHPLRMLTGLVLVALTVQMLVGSTALLRGLAEGHIAWGWPIVPLSAADKTVIVNEFVRPIIAFDPWGVRGAGMAELMPDPWPPAVIMGIALHLACTGMMWTLGATRRSAGIDTPRLLRAFVYGWGFLAGLGLLVSVRDVLIAASRVSNVDMVKTITAGFANLHALGPDGPLEPIVTVAMLMGIVMWWRATLSVGWRLPSASSIWTLLMFCGGVAAVTTLAVVRQDVVWYLIDR